MERTDKHVTVFEYQAEFLDDEGQEVNVSALLQDALDEIIPDEQIPRERTFTRWEYDVSVATPGLSPGGDGASPDTDNALETGDESETEATTHD